MKITSGMLTSLFGAGLLRTTALVALALGVTLALLFAAGPVEADEGDGFLVPIVLEEGRTPPPDGADPPSVRDVPDVQTIVPIVPKGTRDAPKIVQRQVQGNGASITETAVVLVGNNSKADAGQLQFNRDLAQAFTTGTNAAGYKLTSVDIASNVTLASVGNWDVKIAAGGGGAGPGSTVTGDLSEPTGLTTGIGNSFTSTNGIDLNPSTTYYVLIDLSAENTTAYLKSTKDHTEDSNPAAGWSIGNGSHRRTTSSTTTNWTSLSTHNLKIRVNGYAKVAPVVSSVTVNGSSLVLNFDKDLDTTSVPAASRFTIEAAGTSHTATAITVSGREVRLTVPAVKAGQFVTVSYSKPGSNPLKGTNGLAVDAFSNKQATNNTQSLAPSPADTPGVSSTTLISNTVKNFDGYVEKAGAHAQSFTTGSNSGGYTLTSVRVRVQPFSTPVPSNYSVSIRADSSGVPGTSLGTLTKSGSLSPLNAWTLVDFPVSGDGIDL
ncbi:MAG: SwmB domain-containing protein, partial [Chloroflexi bacterium]|nr:SwmB domain-containing protein [Chloroflexota bacterium]